MATIAKAYGSITIVDISDLGTLSVYPSSNQPQSVIYDPNTPKFLPDWSATNLKLQPIIYYGGQQVSLNSTGLTVTWTKKINSGTAAAISEVNGEIVSGHILTVNKNFVDVAGTGGEIITYIVNVKYIEPQTNIALNAEGQITFSMITQATTLKTIAISGDSVFKYNSEGAIVGANQITLTAKSQGCNISKWQYKSSENWIDIDGATTATLSVSENQSQYFSNDKAEFKVLSNVVGIEDVFTIIKLRDGANGTEIVSAILDNEDQMILADENGNVADLSQAVTTMHIYLGSEEITSDYTITASSSLPGMTFSQSGATFTITAFPSSENAGNLVITAIPKATAPNETILSKTFSLVKVQPGADGESPVVYELQLDTLITKLNQKDNVFSPSFVTAKAFKYVGNEKEEFNGYFTFQTNASNSVATNIPASGQSVSSSTTYNFPSANNYNLITVSLYRDGVQSNLLDTQTIVVTQDGRGVASVKEFYLVTNQNSGVTVEGSVEWQENSPKNSLSAEKPYLWNYEETTYTDGSVENSVPTLIGSFGVGIAKTTIEYGQSSDGANSSSVTSWQSSRPEPIDGHFIWTRTTISYTDNSPSSVSYSVTYNAKNGENGSSVSITSQKITYAIHNSGTSSTGIQESDWKDSPLAATADKKYLWTRTVVTYSDGESTTSYSVSYLAKEIQEIHNYYQVNNSATPPSADGANWEGPNPASIPIPTANNKYLWNYEEVVYTDGTNSTSEVALIGAYGDTGATGAGGLSFGLENYQDVIPCDSNGATLVQQDITIPFYAYEGISRIEVTAAITGLATGITVQSNTKGTSSTGGSLVLRFAKGSNLGGTNTGTINITLTANGKTSVQKYTWTKSIQGADGISGANAVMLQLFTESAQGNQIINGQGTVKIAALMTSGAEEVTPSSYVWYKHNGTSYEQLAGENGGTLEVTAQMVNSYASFKCEAVYEGNTYSAFYAVYDRSDPLQITIYSSIGDKITNGVGVGVVYSRTFRAGEEIDQPKNLKIVTSEDSPTTALEGDYLVRINQTNKTVKLSIYRSGVWEVATANDASLNYIWSYMDGNGNPLTTTYSGGTDETGRFLYVDGDLINKKIQFNLEVSIK